MGTTACTRCGSHAATSHDVHPRFDAPDTIHLSMRDPVAWNQKSLDASMARMPAFVIGKYGSVMKQRHTQTSVRETRVNALLGNLSRCHVAVCFAPSPSRPVRPRAVLCAERD